jgi:hypothetical protein
MWEYMVTGTDPAHNMTIYSVTTYSIHHTNAYSIYVYTGGGG